MAGEKAIAGDVYKMAGVEAYCKFEDGRHELLSLRAVFCRVNETPRTAVTGTIFKELLDPAYVAPELYQLSADEVLRAALCAQPGIVAGRFKDAAGKADAIARIAADLGPEKMREAFTVMARVTAEHLPRFEGSHFVAVEKLAPKI